MNVYRLLGDALFITSDRRYWVLPQGCHIAAVHPAPPGLVTGANVAELYVAAPDVVHRVWRGWISPYVPRKPRAGELKDVPVFVWPRRRAMSLSALDRFRQLVIAAVPRDGYDRHHEPVRPWTALSWLAVNGRAHPELLRQLAKELRVRYIKDDVDTLVARLVRALTHQEVSVSTVQKTRRAAKKESAQRGADKLTYTPSKKSAKPAAPKQDASIGLGQKLSETAMAKNATVLKLKSDKPVTHKELVALRDAIKVKAAALREAKKTSAASVLSSLNRLVRRLERSVRK